MRFKNCVGLFTPPAITNANSVHVNDEHPNIPLRSDEIELILVPKFVSELLAALAAIEPAGIGKGLTDEHVRMTLLDAPGSA